MMKNKNMHKAKKAKNDEFYTMMSDIEKELFNYKDHFQGKTVYCNADDPRESNFFKYFVMNFKFLGLKKLIATSYLNSPINGEKQSKKIEVNGIVDGIGTFEDIMATADVKETPLKGDGDFRSEECIEFLKESDIVVTNPPFSLFREYIAQLIEYDKKFLVIGNMNAITYKEIFPIIKNNKLWLGFNSPKEFIQPDSTTKKFGNILWFTNLKHSKRNEELLLYKSYKGNEDDYPKYDNYDAINVNKVADIPLDYDGVMGVPITFLSKYNPDQFELMGLCASRYNPDIVGIPFIGEREGRPIVKGKVIYARLFIKYKK